MPPPRFYGAIAAIALFALGLFLAPGEIFVRFQLDAVEGQDGRTVIIQTRRAPLPIAFHGRWSGVVFEVTARGVAVDRRCSGSGSGPYTWDGPEPIAAFHATVREWLEDPGCSLIPGKQYIARATWCFTVLGAERCVTTSSGPFLARPGDE